jgi:hypothetical protein
VLQEEDDENSRRERKAGRKRKKRRRRAGNKCHSVFPETDPSTAVFRMAHDLSGVG